MELQARITIASFINRVADEHGDTLTADQARAELARGRAGERYEAEASREVLALALEIVLGREPEESELDYARAEWRETYGLAVARTA